jgi:hypothetical protein
MIVYVKDPGVYGIVLDQYRNGCMVKWFLDGISFTSFLEKEEFLVIEEGGLDDE